MTWFGREKNAPTDDAVEPAVGPEHPPEGPPPAGPSDETPATVLPPGALSAIGDGSSEDLGQNPNAQAEQDEKAGWWLITRRVIGWISTILMIALLFLAWPLAWGGLFSYTVVSGNSMEPTYQTGDVVMTYRTSDYQVGEIIVYTVTFDDKTGAIIHRIIEVLPDGTYRTKGDNNDFADPWVAEPQNIRGEVIAVFPQAYKVIGLIRSPLFWILPIGVMVAFFLWPAPAAAIPPDGEGGEPEEREGGGPSEDPDGLGPTDTDGGEPLHELGVSASGDTQSHPYSSES